MNVLASPRPAVSRLASVEEDAVTSTTDTDTAALYGRRNPWGQLSYAELITRAIQSSEQSRWAGIGRDGVT